MQEKCDNLKEKIKNLKTWIVSQRFQSIYKKLLSCWLKYRKDTESKTPKIVKTNNRRIMLLSKCAVCDCKNQNLSNSKKQVD